MTANPATQFSADDAWLEGAPVQCVQSASSQVRAGFVSTHGHVFNMVRRLLPLTPAFFGLMNSINMVNSQAALLSSTTPVTNFQRSSNPTYTFINENTECAAVAANAIRYNEPQWQPSTGEYQQTISYTDFGWNCCDAGISSVKISCSVGNEAEYLVFIAAWCLIWVYVLVTLNWMPKRYGTDDLRYYIAVAKVKTTKFTLTAVGLVVLLTVGGFLFVLTKIEEKVGKNEFSKAEENDAIIQAILALVINLGVVFPLLRAPYPALRRVSMHKDFPDPIPIIHIIPPSIGNLWTMIQPPEEVFRVLTQSMIADLLTGRDDDLNAMGDPAALKRAMLLIQAPEDVSELDAKAKKSIRVDEKGAAAGQTVSAEKMPGEP